MFIIGNQQDLDLTLFVDNKLIFKNPQSGRIKKVKVGFSYPTLFFGWIALCVKGLPGYGLIVLGIQFAGTFVISLLSLYVAKGVSYRGHPDGIFLAVIFLCPLALHVFLGFYANQWQAKSLIGRGWILQNADAAKDALKNENWQLS